MARLFTMRYHLIVVFMLITFAIGHSRASRSVLGILHDNHNRYIDTDDAIFLFPRGQALSVIWHKFRKDNTKQAKVQERVQQSNTPSQPKQQSNTPSQPKQQSKSSKTSLRSGHLREMAEVDDRGTSQRVGQWIQQNIPNPWGHSRPRPHIKSKRSSSDSLSLQPHSSASRKSTSGYSRQSAFDNAGPSALSLRHPLSHGSGTLRVNQPQSPT